MKRTPINQHQRHGIMAALTVLREKLIEQKIAGVAISWFGTDDEDGGGSVYAGGDIAESLRVSGMALGIAFQACQPTAMRDTTELMDDAEPTYTPAETPEPEKES